MGSLTSFFTAISTLAKEYQTAGNAVLIGIALLILGSKFLIGDDETKARGRKQVPYIILVLQAIQIIYRWEIDHANCHMPFGYRPEDRPVSMILLCLRCHPPQPVYNTNICR